MFKLEDIFISLSLMKKIYNSLKDIDEGIRNKLKEDGLIGISEVKGGWKGTQKLQFEYYGKYIKYQNYKSIYYGFNFDLLKEGSNEFIFSVGLQGKIIPEERLKRINTILSQTKNKKCIYIEGDLKKDPDDKWYYFPIDRNILLENDFGENLKNKIITIIENNILEKN